MEAELRINFKGKVQGVFFRYRVKKHAEKFSLNGYAKNLSDGSVEVRAIGEIKILEKFLENILSSPGKAEIVSEKHSFRETVGSYSGFLIL